MVCLGVGILTSVCEFLLGKSSVSTYVERRASISILMSMDDLEMNVLFIELPNRKHPGSNNRMGAIGISVAGNEFVFNGTSETVSIASNLTLGPDRVRAITVDKNHQVHLSLTKKWPNNKIVVHVEQFSITLTIVFIHQHLDMFWSSHTIDTHNIHGILGKESLCCKLNIHANTRC